MLEKLDIYNLALSHLKEAPLVALTDNRKARTDCDIHYDIARLTLLKKHDWSFARQVIVLTAITPDDDELIEGYDYYFEIPPEVLAIRGVYIHGDYSNKLEPKEVYLPISKLKVIASNYDALDAICTMDIQESKYTVMPTATINTVGMVIQYIGETGGGYTKRAFYKGITTGTPAVYSWQLTTEKASSDTNLELLDITFCDALSFELAGRICPTVTGDDNLAIQMLQKSEIKVQEAKTANLSEKYMFQERTSDTLSARG